MQRVFHFPMSGSRFDAVEVMALQQVGTGRGGPIFEPALDKDDPVHLWSVSGHLPGGGVENIHDFPSSEAALRYARDYARKHGTRRNPETGNWDSLWDEIHARGIPYDHHESDLYIPVTAETTALVRQYDRNHTAEKFISQTDGKPWFDIPFAYLPWWEKRTGRRNPGEIVDHVFIPISERTVTLEDDHALFVKTTFGTIRIVSNSVRGDVSIETKAYGETRGHLVLWE